MAVTKNYLEQEQQRINNQKAASASNSTGGFNASPVSQQRKAEITKITQPAAQYNVKQNPGSYNSRYQGAMNAILAQIQNPDDFKYEFNGDELFKNYADLYTQYGKQASLDAMGQAAGLTGGYGNSYAQQAGQQGYQQYLLGLYDKGLDLRNTAYQGYRDQLNDLKDTYNMYAQADAADYARYQDAVAAWQQQQQLDLERERWEMQLAQMAAANQGGGGGGGGGGGKTYYRVGDKYYRQNSDGSVSEVPASQFNPDKDRIDPSLQNAVNNLQSGANLLTQGVSNVGKNTVSELNNFLSGIFKK